MKKYNELSPKKLEYIKIKNFKQTDDNFSLKL